MRVVFVEIIEINEMSAEQINFLYNVQMIVSVVMDSFVVHIMGVQIDRLDHRVIMALNVLATFVTRQLVIVFHILAPLVKLVLGVLMILTASLD